MTIDLANLDRVGVLRCRAGLARALLGAGSLEESAGAACHYFHDAVRSPEPSGLARACALVQLLKTHRYGLLPPSLQRRARATSEGGAPVDAATPCMALLASFGDDPTWCSEHATWRSDCIPLDGAEASARAPTWSRFFRESAVDAATVWRDRSPAILDPSSWAANVFCIERAPGSSSVREHSAFVRRHGIQSVFGFCGRLRRGDIYILVLYSRTTVSRAAAALLRPLALDLTSTLLRFDDARVFKTPAPAIPS